MNYDDILKIIYDTITNLNQYLEADSHMALSEELVILGEDSPLDSIAFVSFIADLEDRLNEYNGDFELTLLDERVLYAKDNPFRTVRTIANHILNLQVGRAERV